MSVELTNEDKVTKLLLASNFITQPAISNYQPNKNSLGQFLSKIPQEHKNKRVLSKYSFIDESLKWGF